MKTALCLLVVVALTAQGALAMVGGDVVTDSSTYSYQVAIRPLRGQAVTNVCSGILIMNGSLPCILTSATCALSGQQFQIWLGTNTVQMAVTAPDVTIDASTAIIHPDFLTSFSEGDLALIPDPGTIKTYIDNTNTTRKTVTAALLPNVDDTGKSYLASSVRMAGWGYPNEAYHLNSPKLRQLTSRVVPNFYCSAIHFGKPVTGNHICTGGLINKGPCTGDSGAPLILNSNGSNRVIGLATLTPNNGCSKSKPGVFTSLGKYLTWIAKVTNYDVEQ